MPSVLFVCTANQFRSPLATAYFRQELLSRGMNRDWTVESAGTWTWPGSPAVPQAQQAAIEAGLNLGNHTTRQVSLALLDRFDLVIAMETGQVEAMKIEFPSMSKKIHLLAEVTNGKSFNIPDPILSETEPSEVSAELSDLIKRGFERIVSLANLSHGFSTKD